MLKFNPRPQGVGVHPVSEAHSNHKPHATHVKKAAFTLAEVLITLGIIGVVAAMTIPTLISNYQNKQLKAKLNKTYSVLSQAVSMIYAETGLPITSERYLKRGSFYKELMKYMRVYKDCGLDGCLHGNEDDMYSLDMYQIYSKKGIINTVFFDDGQFILQDGTFVLCENTTNNIAAGLLITVDINGMEQGPNIWGHDLFSFEIMDNRLLPSGAKGTHYDLETHSGQCSETSVSTLNGIACTEKALTEPDYFKNLP